MNIKSLLLGSAAALAAVSGAQAADAIVAVEPEPMDYVRVCDAFGTGYFYIPGTETCLKIGGEVRATVRFGDKYNDSDHDWNTDIRARVTVDAKNDSEVGTIGSYIRLQANTGNFSDSNTFSADQAYITVGGFKVGKVLNWIDDFALPGESDYFFTTTNFNSASYTYAADAFSVGVSVDDLSDYNADYDSEVGVTAMASGAFGPVAAVVYGFYDFNAEEGGVAGVLSADVGPGTFYFDAAYSSGENAYTDPNEGYTAEWTVGAAYAFKATDKLTITPNANYYGDFMFGDGDAWSADLLVEYQLAAGLKVSSDLEYLNADDLDDDQWSGFVRLTRSF
ncbi:porin [Rhizobium halophytocola]|uniref:Porin n=1 Tax=Rhizobium halophytocola TaxID=735519 RepID=A0ABS4DYU6_9HYPH|nr:porin [Rhizobium halophytocola]MBP1850850.1 hypothetical protein [Rhizobium halophytocola]